MSNLNIAFTSLSRNELGLAFAVSGCATGSLALLVTRLGIKFVYWLKGTKVEDQLSTHKQAAIDTIVFAVGAVFGLMQVNNLRVHLALADGQNRRLFTKTRDALESAHSEINELMALLTAEQKKNAVLLEISTNTLKQVKEFITENESVLKIGALFGTTMIELSKLIESQVDKTVIKVSDFFKLPSVELFKKIVSDLPSTAS